MMMMMMMMMMASYYRIEDDVIKTFCKGPVKLIKGVKIVHSFFTVGVKSVPLYHFKPTYVILQMAVKKVQVPNFWGVSGSEDRGGGDSSIQLIIFGRVADKILKNGEKDRGWKGG